MNLRSIAQAKRFHGYLDADTGARHGPVTATKAKKLFFIQERELNYSFSLHQHPYVQSLVQRLLRKGTSGLQAADTDYAPDNASLPGSVQVAVGKDANLTITASSRIALIGNVQATSAGVPIELTAGMNFKLAGAVRATAPSELKAILVDGLADTPTVGSPVTLPADSIALVAGETALTLTPPIAVIRHNGEQATIASTTTALVADGTQVTLPNDIQPTLLKSKRLPVLFEDFFDTTYAPNSELVQQPYPVKDLDFSSSGAYAVYNWELFYHVPITIAIHLSKNQRFAEAQRWFHFCFDPTDDSDGPTPERFWKVRPFQSTDVKKFEEILVNLTTGADTDLRNETIRSIEAWKAAPFRPHVVARYRQQAYMYKTVMAYLDNLIAWGDSLFRQDTGEAIDEALMLYVLAANILGPRPLPVPKKGTVRPQTYANLRKDLAQFGTVLREMEPEMSFDLMPFPSVGSGDNARLETLRSLGKALYFCVPRNDKLLSYWDTVADRLFKIRNSLNVQGAFRQLALFEPPIDPALLARAAAAGLDVATIVNGLNQPLPQVRFTFLVQKAAEICQEVKSLGNNLLSAMEKEDGEAMSLLRAKHERAVMDMVEHVKYGQLQETIKSKEGLFQTMALAMQRYTYYERQLGKKPDEIQNAIPQLADLDKDGLHKMMFAMTEPAMALREIKVDIAQDLGGSGGKIISKHENDEIAKLQESRDLNDEAATKDKIAAGLSLLPELGIDFHFWGMGGHVSFGGSALSKSMSFWASFAKTDAEKKSFESSNSSRIGSYGRREQDWAFQSNLAAGEISQIFKQIRAAEIRLAIAELELKNHRQQMRHAQEIEHFLNEEGIEKTGKKTNKPLYAWMKREVKGLYGQCFQFAFDICKKAERALQHELGNPELSSLQFDYLAGKEGLLAGEKLYLDIKRMEMAYHDQNQREYELTKHVSLLQVDPLSLIQLRTTGRCTFRLPESLFDMDGPGHYFRRIKTLAISIPCVTGPYASVNCTLTLIKSSIRKTQLLLDGVYTREDAEDGRFDDHFGSLQSIVTSTAQNDSGMFETNMRDERYLPFENSGVISEWQLQLPANPSDSDPCQFEYNTISDVILHMRYTAREGGNLLRNEALVDLKRAIEEATGAGSVRLFSVRHEFPSAWAMFKSTGKFSLGLLEEHYPFWSKGLLKGIKALSVIAEKGATIDRNDDAGVKKDSLALVRDPKLGLFIAAIPQNNLSQINPIGSLFFSSSDKSLNDLWIALAWGG